MGLEGCGKEGQQGGDGSDGKELLAMQETEFNPGVRKIPWNSKWHPTPIFLPGKFHGRAAWWARIHGIAKSPNMTEKTYPRKVIYPSQVLDQTLSVL